MMPFVLDWILIYRNSGSINQGAKKKTTMLTCTSAKIQIIINAYNSHGGLSLFQNLKIALNWNWRLLTWIGRKTLNPKLQTVERNSAVDSVSLGLVLRCDFLKRFPSSFWPDDSKTRAFALSANEGRIKIYQRTNQNTDRHEDAIS